MRSPKSQLQAWLTEMGLKQDCDLLLSSEGKCSIKVNGSEVIHLTGPADDDTFLINVELLAVDDATPSLVLRKALGLNLFQEATMGATIALDAASDHLILSYLGRYQSSSYQDFINIFTNMALLAARLKQQLSDLLSEMGADSVTDEPMAMSV